MMTTYHNLQIAKISGKYSLVDFVESRFEDMIKTLVHVVEYSKEMNNKVIPSKRASVYVNRDEMTKIAYDITTGKYGGWSESEKTYKWKGENKKTKCYEYIVRGGNLEKNHARELQIRIFKKGETLTSEIIAMEGTAKKIVPNDAPKNHKGLIAIEKISTQAYTVCNLRVLEHAMHEYLTYNQAVANREYQLACESKTKQQSFWQVNEFTPDKDVAAN